jgi:lipopolysaccharide/colanic/teichoic acid biosynthesis glycosyltransferase
MKVPSLKRAFDVALSATGIVILTPLMIVTAAAMAVTTRSFPLFLQQRIGRNGKPFTIFKIKTMRDSPHDPFAVEGRTTRLSRMIRRSRLDELPQLFNILKGDMSFVGPRPLVENKISLDPVRIQIKPGLTGLAQLAGSSLPGGEILGRDKTYIRKTRQMTPLSQLFYDVSIIRRTIPALIAHRRDPHARKQTTTGNLRNG